MAVASFWFRRVALESEIAPAATTPTGFDGGLGEIVLPALAALWADQPVNMRPRSSSFEDDDQALLRAPACGCRGE